jgi:hypothetical protein
MDAVFSPAVMEQVPDSAKGKALAFFVAYEWGKVHI